MHDCTHSACVAYTRRETSALQWSLPSLPDNCSICFYWGVVIFERCEVCVCVRDCRLACKVNCNPGSKAIVTASVLPSVLIRISDVWFVAFITVSQHPSVRGPFFLTSCPHETEAIWWELSSLAGEGQQSREKTLAYKLLVINMYNKLHILLWLHRN